METPQDFFGTAVRKLAPGGAYDTDGKTILVWKSPDVEEPSQADIDAKIVELEAEWTAQSYSRNRKKEYDALNQFEMQFDDELNDTTTWKDAINAIKAKYPKP
jgi:phage tail sheath protein FI